MAAALWPADSAVVGARMNDSNRLPVLAAEIKAAHAGVKDHAKIAAQYAIDAGHKLIEAKALLKHGTWLPWLREHCEISERSAQLYMKIAELGLKSETVAVLGLKGASKVIAQICDDSYNPWFLCDERAKRDWHLFMLFLVRHSGYRPEQAWAHTEYLLQKQFVTPCEYLGDEGARWRKNCRMREPSPEFQALWAEFLANNTQRLTADLHQELCSIYDAAGPEEARQRRSRAKLRKNTAAIIAKVERRHDDGAAP